MNTIKAHMQRARPLFRSLRFHPIAAGQPPRPRHFNSKTPLLLLNRSPARPQLPFLARTRRQSPSVARLLSTEQVAHIKYQIKLGLYWVVLSWTVIGAGHILYLFLRQDWLDKQFPGPGEWQISTKWFWRIAKYEELEQGPERGMIDWGKVATNYRIVAQMLENQKSFIFHRPSGIKAQNDWDRSIPGATEEIMRAPSEHQELTRIGYDISMKSDDWKRGYFEAMIGASRAGEHQVGRLTYNGITYEPHQVRSESNPIPVPFPKGFSLSNPDAKDCQPAFETPDFHYLRLLTTKGFSRKQRIQAGVYFADWLGRSDRPELAEQMYHWSLDLATDGVPQGSKFVNTKTGVIDKAAPYTTQNLLLTATALASHYARTERIPQALNVYLSVIRARRSSPEAVVQYMPKGPDYSLRSFDSVLAFIGSLHRLGNFPPDLLTGDEPFERSSNTACDEAAVMTYVGEILFARANKKIEGLSWTRDASRIAEQGFEDARLDRHSKDICTQCFETGLGNWQRMISTLAAEKKEPQAGQGRSGWLWSKSKDSAIEDADWTEEERLVKRKKQKFESDQLTRRLDAAVRQTSKLFVI